MVSLSGSGDSNSAHLGSVHAAAAPLLMSVTVKAPLARAPSPNPRTADQYIFLHVASQKRWGEPPRRTRNGRSQYLYGSPEISGHECLLSQAAVAGRSYRAGDAGAQATAQSERIRRWLVANRFQAVSQASMISGRLANTELASQWLRR